MRPLIGVLVAVIHLLVRQRGPVCASGTCSGGMLWQECVTACPLTCGNYFSGAVDCELPCMEGCACPEGTVELDGVCVEPSACAACNNCREGQKCSATKCGNRDIISCKDPVAVPCSPHASLACPTTARCLTHSVTGTSFCLESCFMQNGGCLHNQTCHSTRRNISCDPLMESCFTSTFVDAEGEGDGGICPVGLELNQCGSLCQRTCEDYLTGSKLDCTGTCGLPACVCPEGMVVFKDRCVDPLECYSLINYAVVGFEKTLYVVDEPQEVVEVCAMVYSSCRNKCPIPFAFEVHISTVENSIDLEPLSTILSFAACETRRCVNVTIVNDDEVENSELHTLILDRSTDSRIILAPATSKIEISDDDALTHRCYTNPYCNGFSFPMPTAKQCCVDTDHGMSYSLHGSCIITHCVVHGFGSTSYTTSEGGTVITTFGKNVKGSGSTRFRNLQILGNVTSIIETAQAADFEDIGRVAVASEYVSIPLVTIEDEISLEYEETVTLMFIPDVSNIMSIADTIREFIRDKTTISIIDNDRLQISFDRGYYSMQEGESEGAIMKLQFTETQNPFTVTFFPVSISNAILYYSVADFIMSTDTDEATADADFSDLSFTVTVPATYNTTGDSDYEVFHSSIIIDDVQVENTQIFAVVTILDKDVPDDLACFQRQLNDTECFGRSGAVEFRIFDNDQMVEVGMEKTAYEISEGVPVIEICVIVHSPVSKCPVEFPFDIRLTTNDNTATAPMDYKTVAKVLSFAECDTRQCVHVTIVDDVIVEQNEDFSVVLETTPDMYSRITLNPASGHVHIISEDVAVVGLEKTVYHVAEDVCTVEVCVRIMNCSNFNCLITFPLELTLSTINNTAVPPTDYVELSMTIMCVELQSRYCVDISIVDDSTIEKEESFYIVLEKSHNVSSIILNPQRGEIEIDSNDVAVVVLEKTLYNVSEEDGAVEVCAIVKSPRVGCPIAYDFSLILSYSYENEDNDVFHATMSFAMCYVRSCVNITIMDNMAVEDESILLSLHTLETGNEIMISVDSGVTHVKSNDLALVEMERIFYQYSGDVEAIRMAGIVLNSPCMGCNISYSVNINISINNHIADIFYNPLHIQLAMSGLISRSRFMLQSFPERCLLSRLDYLPCLYHNRNIQRASLNNQYSIHYTRLRVSSSGAVECNVRAKNQIIHNITDLGNDVKVIYSPGFLTGQRCDNQLLVQYNIQCGEDQLAFFNVTDIDLQGKEDCHDDDDNPQCQDYILIDRGSFGTTELCGNNTSHDSVLELQSRNFTVYFRTSEDTVARGFRMVIVCFNPEERDLEGCLTPSDFNRSVCHGNRPDPVSDGDDCRSRRRREDSADGLMYGDLFPEYPPSLRVEEDVASFHQQWYRYRHKREPDMQLIRRIIRFNESVYYDGHVVNIIDSNNRKVVKYEDVDIFQTLDTDRQIHRVTNSQHYFSGPGAMTIIERSAYLQMFLIDSRGLIPTEREQEDLHRMNNVPVDAAEYHETIKGKRKRRQDAEEGIEFSESAVFAAMQNFEACNPVLRSQARSTLQYFNETFGERLQELLNFTISCELSGSQLNCSVNEGFEPALDQPQATYCTINDDATTRQKCNPFYGPSAVLNADEPIRNVTVESLNCEGRRVKHTVTAGC